MNTRKFNALLKETLRNTAPSSDFNHYEKTKAACAEVLHSKTARQRIGFGRFLLLQVRFIGWKIWLVQGGILALLLVALLLPVIDTLTLSELTKAICIFSVLSGTSALPLFYLSFYYHMHEVETVTRFSATKLLAAKYLILMTGNAFLLGASFLGAHYMTDLAPFVITIALLLPFLLSIGGNLYFWTHLPAVSAFYVGLIWNLVLVVLIISTANLYDKLLHQSMVWVLVGVLSLGFCITQSLRLERHALFSDNQPHLKGAL